MYTQCIEHYDQCSDADVRWDESWGGTRCGARVVIGQLVHMPTRRLVKSQKLCFNIISVIINLTRIQDKGQNIHQNKKVRVCITERLLILDKHVIACFIFNKLTSLRVGTSTSCPVITRVRDWVSVHINPTSLHAYCANPMQLRLV